MLIGHVISFFIKIQKIYYFFRNEDPFLLTGTYFLLYIHSFGPLSLKFHQGINAVRNQPSVVCIYIFCLPPTSDPRSFVICK